MERRLWSISLLNPGVLYITFARSITSCCLVDSFRSRKRRIEMVIRRSLISSIVVILITSAACSFSVSTANLSGLKIGKDKTVSQETGTFGAEDTVYAVGTVSNAPDKVKVKGRLVIDDVPGQQPGP